MNSFYRGGGYRSYPRRGFGGRNLPKTINPALFVQKAVNVVEEEYVPKHTFEDFNIAPSLLSNIKARGYKNPTPIQDETIPHLLQGRDVVGIAETGTGKTAAFLIPLINQALKDRYQKVLIVVPTRELAVQIETEFQVFRGNSPLYSAICIGGVSIVPQIRKLQRRPQFVIGTPGRLKDLEKQGVLEFREFNAIVLDEVDRMLDMGFIREISYIIEKLPTPRQSLFFSATTTPAVTQIMQRFLTNPITISVKKTESSLNVDQDVVHIGTRHKAEVLVELLNKENFDKVLIFCRTKRGVEKLLTQLYEKRIDAASIHGGKKQSQRQRAIQDFKNNGVKVLLATDVASRGLDIDHVTHVINYDQPESHEDYIHRIGRTGRAGRKGVALTFIP